MAGYVSYKITDKLTINGRGEYAYGSAFDYLDPLYVKEVAAGVSQRCRRPRFWRPRLLWTIKCGTM